MKCENPRCAPCSAKHTPAEVFTLTGNPASQNRVQIIRYADGRMLLATSRGAVPISGAELGELADCAAALAASLGVK